MNNRKLPFNEELTQELDLFLSEQSQKFPENEVLKIDMHCHDHNSNVPEELLGRMLKLSETWLSTEDLMDSLKKHGSTAFTITNHNHGKSTFELKEKGIDILTAAEFSCYVPDYKTGIHVLTYGFNPDQEKVLNKLRGNVYDFQTYTCEEDIPTVWAHPLYHYSPKGVPPFEFFQKMALIFQRFEVLNGQRDTWQNMLVKSWIDTLDEDMINDLANRFSVDPYQYNREPFKKSVTGGSDSHMGIFAGLTGTYLHVPNLEQRLKTTSTSDLALEAIRNGRMAPYGSHNTNEKLTVAFLDYVCQVAIHHKDPGLLRIMLHKGSVKDKMNALLISNAFGELRRHKVTMKFIDLFHKCFQGEVPHFSKRWFVSSDYKTVYDDARKIAEAKKYEPENMAEIFTQSIESIHRTLTDILMNRLKSKFSDYQNETHFSDFLSADFISKLEVPSELRTLFQKSGSKPKNQNGPDIPNFLDGLSFPFLTSTLILAAYFASTRVLFNARNLLTEFSENIGKFKHPKRVLWLTDTYNDHNGVSSVLQNMHQNIVENDYPIDIMVCSNDIESDRNLIVLKPIAEFEIPAYQQQPIRIPNFLEIHKLFQNGNYDRIVCSTEGVMGIVSLFLKHAFVVPAQFYVHTDWMMFAEKTLGLEGDNLSRVRRLLRAFYRGFDGLFVLNTDHQKYFSSKHIGFNSEDVKLTAHWVPERFHPVNSNKLGLFGLEETEPVLLFSGRVSAEKGVFELPSILKKVRNKVPNVKLVIAGHGPAEDELKSLIPDAIFLGWVDQKLLPQIYSSADLLILPSKFDTFSCVVLESLSCGLPVITYNTKGPKDIISHLENGFLVNKKADMTDHIVHYLNSPFDQVMYQEAAMKRAKDYTSKSIMSDLIQNLGLDISQMENEFAKS